MHFDDVLEQIGKSVIYIKINNNKNKTQNLFPSLGEGIFQKFAIFVCGLAVLAEAIATASVPFAMILASCDLKISTDHILGLNAIFLLGNTKSIIFVNFGRPYNTERFLQATFELWTLLV